MLHNCNITLNDEENNMADNLGWFLGRESGGKSLCQGSTPDPISERYPAVCEEENPLPRYWNPKDKFVYLGLSHSNLRVHYKGEFF